jgi:4-azaleucine resistance transporter AzlC
VSKNLAAKAFEASIPVMLGYVPLGIAFGILFTDLGYHWFFAFLMALVVFAGSAQFLSIGLLASGAGLVEIGLTTLILNSRHMFFGLSLLDRFRVGALRKFYLIFSLTDETFAVTSTTPAPEGSRPVDFHFLVAAFNQAAWVSGCTIGGVLGQAVSFDTTGMDFALTALFTVLVIEQYLAVREVFPFLLAASVGVFVIVVLGQENMLMVSITLSLLLLLIRGRRRSWA